jgi:hypothetical protein
MCSLRVFSLVKTIVYGIAAAVVLTCALQMFAIYYLRVQRVQKKQKKAGEIRRASRSAQNGGGAAGGQLDLTTLPADFVDDLQMWKCEQCGMFNVVAQPACINEYCGGSEGAPRCKRPQKGVLESGDDDTARWESEYLSWQPAPDALQTAASFVNAQDEDDEEEEEDSAAVVRKSENAQKKVIV